MRTARRGFTLIEVLSALMIMSLIVGTLGVMANAVYFSSEYGQGHATVAQHARVALLRISRAARGAYATESYPGFGVIDETVGAWRFADTLVVWRPRVTPSTPTAEPFNADGPPRFNELVIFCTDPDEPHKLIELTADDSDTRIVNDATLAADVEALKRLQGVKKVVLTDLLHTASLNDGLSDQRGAVRFEVELNPSEQQWTDFEAGTLAWNELPWVQGVYSSKTGLRQVWLRIELQLTPAVEAGLSDAEQLPPVPFFGSAALYYEMNKP